MRDKLQGVVEWPKWNKPGPKTENTEDSKRLPMTRTINRDAIRCPSKCVLFFCE